MISQNYKTEFIEFLLDAGVLKFGNFIAKSGRKLPYFINAGDIKTGKQIERLGEFYAQCYLDKVGAEKNTVLFGPAYKGIPLSVSAAAALAKHDIDVPFFFNRKEAKDHGEGGVFVGYTPNNGEDIIIIEDVITAGTAIRESMALMQNVNAKVAGVIIMVNRMEKGKTDMGAMEEITAEFGFPVYSIVTIYDIIDYLETHPERLPSPDHIDRIREYLKEYGAKQA
ncbi:MAG: orotate phosphoribosyltransferase [Clostridia bacterium]|nr:orotate phosphoribosyltransferase [Clostridia bacterium]